MEVRILKRAETFINLDPVIKFPSKQLHGKIFANKTNLLMGNGDALGIMVGFPG